MIFGLHSPSWEEQPMAASINEIRTKLMARGFCVVVFNNNSAFLTQKKNELSLVAFPIPAQLAGCNGCVFDNAALLRPFVPKEFQFVLALAGIKHDIPADRVVKGLVAVADRWEHWYYHVLCQARGQILRGEKPSVSLVPPWGGKEDPDWHSQFFKLAVPAKR